MPLTMSDTEAPPPHDDQEPPSGGIDLEGSDSATTATAPATDAVVWFKRITMAVALAFLVGALGYFIGVRTTYPPGNEVDAGFLRDMTDHHDQAVTMAEIELAYGADPVAKAFAMEVIMFQQRELGRFQNFAEERGFAPADYSPERTTMEWMGMPTPLKDMPGMATDEQLDALRASRGVEADKLFLTLMQTHHLGGAHMSDHEAKHGADPKIRDMAATMARNQRAEIGEYQRVLNRLNGAK
jgi:uncharacterized protein (DUF305 family)